MSARHKRKNAIRVRALVASFSGRRLIASIGGLALVAGAVVTGVSMHDGGSLTGDAGVTRPDASSHGASRDYDRESLLTESVSVDTNDDATWSLGDSNEQVAKNLNEQAKAGDDASAAKRRLNDLKSKAKALSTDGKTDESVSKLKKAIANAESVLKGDMLKTKASYDKASKTLSDAMNGLADKPVAVMADNGLSGVESSDDTKTGGPSQSAGLGVTVPVNEMQKWFHDYLLSNGYTEEDFTAASYIIQHESGWNPHATNPSSGAYGLGQALPGSKMASHGSDWQSNYQTQLKWFMSYAEGRYHTLQNAYHFWVQNHWW